MISLFLEALKKTKEEGARGRSSHRCNHRSCSRGIFLAHSLTHHPRPPPPPSSITIFLPAIKGCTSPSAYQHSIPSTGKSILPTISSPLLHDLFAPQAALTTWCKIKPRAKWQKTCESCSSPPSPPSPPLPPPLERG